MSIKGHLKKKTKKDSVPMLSIKFISLYLGTRLIHELSCSYNIVLAVWQVGEII